MEHHSNLVPWQMLAQEKKIKIQFIPILENDTFNLVELDKVITSRCRLVSVAHMSNVTGTIHPVREIIKAARIVGAKVLLDGAQAVNHLQVDVNELDCDFYCFSAHKMCGPTGVGILYGKWELLEKMQPYHGGGNMIEKVNEYDFTPASLPNKFEAGTPNIAGVIGFGVAVEYLQRLGMDRIRKNEMRLTEYCIKRLDELGGVYQYGPRDLSMRGGICSFNIGNVHSHDVATILDERNIAIRAGHHCALPFMNYKKIVGMNRASFCFYNSRKDVDKLISALKKVKEIFKDDI
jgi:cysteine desulfurase/selenocysteine lyase